MGTRTADRPDSYFTATMNPIREFPVLQGETRADVCVIGGGYTGLSSAIHLAERGYSVVLLEAERVGWKVEVLSTSEAEPARSTRRPMRGDRAPCWRRWATM